MNIRQNSSHSSLLLNQTLNGILLLITLILAAITYFFIQEILVAVTAMIVIRATTNISNQIFVVGLVRNFWVVIGSCSLLAFVIIGLDYHAKRLEKPQTRKILLWTILVEIVLICIGLII